jgi:uncharacterized protein (TIGR02300 family)
VQANRGTKRRCSQCGANFYDLARQPIVCPKCDAPFVAVAPKAPPRPSRPARADPPLLKDETDEVDAFAEDEALADDVEAEEEEEEAVIDDGDGSGDEEARE